MKALDPPKQAGDTAETLAEAMSGAELATAADIATVRSEIAEVKAEISALRTKLNEEIAALRAEVTAEIAALSTALALSGFGPAQIPSASGLFNLMRNLGGAIGLALIDTVLEQRTPAHVASIVARLQAGDASAAPLVGLPTERFTGVPIGEVDEPTRTLVAPLVERAGLVAAFNDAWLLIGGLVLLSMLVLLVRAPPRPAGSNSRLYQIGVWVLYSLDHMSA